MKMESLDLPFDLIWDGKTEPFSPSQFPLANAEDILIFDNNFADEILLYDDLLRAAQPFDDDKKSPAELLADLENSLHEHIDDELGNQWLDESINIPILDDYPVLTQEQPIKVEHTAQLLREFNNVFDTVELTHLTPPQTPPLTPPIHRHSPFDLQAKENEITILNVPQQPLEPIASIASISVIQTSHHHQQQHQQQQPPQAVSTIIQNNQSTANHYYVFDPATTPAQSPMSCQDVAHEMEVVEELVRARAEQLPDWTDDDDADDSTSATSTSSSSSSAGSSASYSPRSESSYGGSSTYSNDDDWSPKRNSHHGHATKRRTKPYGRSVEDKKCRKKEQNKNAATRYRQKKKQEVEVVLGEERELQEKHDKLATKYADVKREISYLKGLMRDLYRVKGLLP